MLDCPQATVQKTAAEIRLRAARLAWLDGASEITPRHYEEAIDDLLCSESLNTRSPSCVTGGMNQLPDQLDTRRKRVYCIFCSLLGGIALPMDQLELGYRTAIKLAIDMERGLEQALCLEREREQADEGGAKKLPF
jgi:hypothetical protein